MEPIKSSLICYPLRIKPGQELKSTLLEFVKKNALKAAFVMTCVGSVTKATLRMARGAQGEVGLHNEIFTFNDYYEILSLVGTLSESGHLHISLGDKEGKVIGGHVVGDLIIYTTAEVVIGECGDAQFSREHSDDTGCKELHVEKRE